MIKKDADKLLTRLRNRPKKGDRVRIKGFAKSVNGKLGFVTRVDGGYFFVRLRWQKHDMELLECEVEKA